MHDIGLFQNQRNWETIKEQVMDLVADDHSVGRAQNGSLCTKLEQRLAQQFNRQYCVTVASCTDALVIGLLAVDLKPASRVAVPNYTFTASAHAVARAGHTVVPVDVAEDYCFDPAADAPGARRARHVLHEDALPREPRARGLRRARQDDARGGRARLHRAPVRVEARGG